MTTTIQARTEERKQRPASILIIDDDIDSALQIESIFNHLGCQTACSLNWAEARKKICAMKPDIIILDWILDQHVDAADVVRHCARTFAKFDRGLTRSHWRRPKIITYSSLQESEIDLLENAYFEHTDHWQKPIRQRDLLTLVLGLLQKMGR